MTLVKAARERRLGRFSSRARPCGQWRPGAAPTPRDHVGFRQATQEVAPTVMPAEFGQQPLVVRIFQASVPQLLRELCLHGFGFDFEVGHRPIAVRVPQRQRLLQQRLELHPKVAGAAGLRCHHLAARPQDVGQALLRVDAVEGLGIVATPSIGDHNPGIVGGNHFRPNDTIQDSSRAQEKPQAYCMR